MERRGKAGEDAGDAGDAKDAKDVKDVKAADFGGTWARWDWAGLNGPIQGSVTVPEQTITLCKDRHFASKRHGKRLCAVQHRNDCAAHVTAFQVFRVFRVSHVSHVLGQSKSRSTFVSRWRSNSFRSSFCFPRRPAISGSH